MEEQKHHGALFHLFIKGKRAFQILTERKFTTIAGTLVFFLVMSLVPFLFWLSLLFSGTGVETDVLVELELFDWAKDLLVFFKENAEGATVGVSLFFLATTLWSSTSFFYHLKRSGEIIYQTQKGRRGWIVRTLSFLFTGVLLVFLFAAGVVLVGACVYGRALASPLYEIIVYSLVFVFGFFTAWLLNVFICPLPQKISSTVVGSVITAALWLLASVVFSVYLRFSSPERLYGALSLFIVFLLWLYWMMICFTCGVVYNAYFSFRFEKS